MAVFMHFRKEGKMSRIYDKYLELKKKDHEKLYLFHCGNFYIFLAEDAEKVSDLFGLKLITFANNVKKCGFPKNALKKYMQLFKTKKLKVQVIEKEKKNKNESLDVKEQDVLKILKSLNLESMSPIESFEVLRKLKGLVDN